jgi:hypothetical protein
MDMLRRFFGYDRGRNAKLDAEIGNHDLDAPPGDDKHRAIAARILLKSQTTNDKVVLYSGLSLLCISIMLFVELSAPFVLASGMLGMGVVLLSYWAFQMKLDALGWCFSILFGGVASNWLMAVAYLIWG